MPIEVDKEEAEEILAKVRHEALLKAIKQSATKNDYSPLITAIQKQSEIFIGFVSAINEIAKQPEVNIELNQTEISQSISQMSADILKGIRELKLAIEVLNQPKEWKFTVKRDSYTNYIEIVTATANNIKPKAQA